jgi:hypothetical protein
MVIVLFFSLGDLTLVIRRLRFLMKDACLPQHREPVIYG